MQKNKGKPAYSGLPLKVLTPKPAMLDHADFDKRKSSRHGYKLFARSYPFKTFTTLRAGFAKPY
ncbi:MAG TPA: hypothetical protein H9869_08480 [Candidatus Ligilactobacillus excrementipullorum]|nr:hypothetical protein [Candidatus Ligilactobacillus excrementipullorum]